MKRNELVLRAWALFIVWIELFSIVLMVGRQQLVEAPLTVVIARLTAQIVRLFGLTVHSEGPLVQTPGFAMEIIPACTALWPTVLFLAAVFAYPCRWREKALGVAVGVPGIFVVNLIRVTSLFGIGLYFPAIFDRAHMVVWQPLVIFSAVAFWLLWATKLTRPPAPAARESA